MSLDVRQVDPLLCSVIHLSSQTEFCGHRQSKNPAALPLSCRPAGQATGSQFLEKNAAGQAAGSQFLVKIPAGQATGSQFLDKIRQDRQPAVNFSKKSRQDRQPAANFWKSPAGQAPTSAATAAIHQKCISKE